MSQQLTISFPADFMGADDSVEINGRRLPVFLRKSSRANHYRITVEQNQSVHVTIPRYGSKKKAIEFVNSSGIWLEKRLSELKKRGTQPTDWRPGTAILFRGKKTRLQAAFFHSKPFLVLGDLKWPVDNIHGNLKKKVEKKLWQMAKKELPEIVMKFARTRKIDSVARVIVRNQKSLWGSCSGNGTLSLNWRLLQVPEFIRDYVICHELAHLSVRNHSHEFWSHLAESFPQYARAEAWLKANAPKVGL